MEAGSRRDWKERAELVEQWRASGLPLAQWAQAHELSHGRLLYWIKRLNAHQQTPKPLVGDHPPPPLTLSRVQVAPAPTSRPSVITLHSPGGWQISVPMNLGTEQLLVLLRGLP